MWTSPAISPNPSPWSSSFSTYCGFQITNCFKAMNIKQLNSEYDKLIKSDDFKRLNCELNTPNIFQALKISEKESSHSNFLSWLLDPSQSHKMGDIFLKKFLKEVCLSDKFDVEGMDLSNVKIYCEWQKHIGKSKRRIDILIVTTDIVVCIENKISSTDHPNQLAAYKEIIDANFPKRKRFFVYLTPCGAPPKEENKDYQTMSYHDIVDALEHLKHFLEKDGSPLNSLVKNYINDYIIMVKKEVINTDVNKLQKQSRKIYDEHQDFFDFIFANKPSIARLKEILQKELEPQGWVECSKDRYYVRFLTKKMIELELIPYNKDAKDGWTNRESFLFEVFIDPDTGDLGFKMTISPPPDKNGVAEKLQEILCGIGKSGFTTEGKGWRAMYFPERKLEHDKINTMTDDEKTLAVQGFYDQVSKIVKTTENQLIKHKSEL